MVNQLYRIILYMSIGLYLASGYIATSLFFFCFPSIIRKKKQVKCQLVKQSLQGKRVLRIAHRGGPRYTTQNTIQAFRKIITITDMLEMDVCETKDKILVVHHDKSLLRTCGVEKNIEDLNYDQLPKFKDQIQLDFSQGKTITSNNQKIPKLQAVFQIFQGTPMNIQLKTPTQSAIKQITKLTYEYDRAGITILGIRSHMQKHLKQQNMIHHFFNDYAVMKIFLAYFTGLLPFISISESSLQLPLYTSQFYNWKLGQRQKEDFKFKAFFSLVKFMNFILKPLIWHLQRRDIVTMMWVCNEQKDMIRAIRLGAHGIMTDDPYLLNEVLKKQKLVPL